jgi:hypothetical protein
MDPQGISTGSKTSAEFMLQNVEIEGFTNIVSWQIETSVVELY